MTHRIHILKTVLLIPCLWLAGTAVRAADLAALAAREELTIVVTDSGLGGLSVAADIARRVEQLGTHRKVNLIFYNALFSADSGYNSLPTRADRIRIFNHALTDMGERYRPDLIMVACNTLSVLLTDCEYAQTGAVPVLGIVESGVALMQAALEQDADAKVVIFATQGTINEDSHRSALIARGVDPARVVGVPCGDLMAYIEQDFEGFDTGLLITNFVMDASDRLGDQPPPVYASLNCTHFGYSLELWQQEIEAAGLELRGVLDPNGRMGDFLFTPSLQRRFAAPEVTVRFVTMVPLTEAAVDSISRAVRPTSALAADALQQHELIPDLFPWRDGDAFDVEIVDYH